MDANHHGSASEIAANDRPQSGMDLEEFRRAKGLSYGALGKKFGTSDRAMVREHALGLKWPRAEMLHRILTKCEGKVTADAMARRHFAYLESIGKLQPVEGEAAMAAE